MLNRNSNLLKMDYYKCRLCLEETSRYVDIFHERFSEMIQILTGIKVEPEDGLPTISCLKCHQEVKSAMLTRYQIINSHKILLGELKFNVEKVLSTYSNHANDKSKIKNELYNSNDQNVSENKNIDIKIDAPTEDYYDSLDNLSCDENAKSDINLSNNISLLTEKREVKEEITDPPKLKYNDNEITKKANQKKTLTKVIKFRKKRTNQQTLTESRIEFKKKKAGSNAHSSKTPYEIKPEYQEFLKTFGRKDRVACPDCGREMFGMNMKNHLITHNYDPVSCEICGKTSKNAQALQDHINYYHKTTPDRFMCDKCGKGYRVRFMLERHEKKEHGNGEKDYECSICGKKFFEKLHLKNHINITHNKIKAYKCEHCGKDFGRRTQFVTHQLVHTKENRYHCQVCGKGFKIKQTMQTHLKGVHGIEEEKTIFCKICQKGFSTSQGLRAHINSRVHGLEKCKHCSEFITVEYKSVHLRDIHGINTEAAYS